MHKLFLRSFLGFFSFSQLFGQKLKQDEVDKFTKKSIKATCTIKIFIPSWKMTVCCK